MTILRVGMFNKYEGFYSEYFVATKKHLLKKVLVELHEKAYNPDKKQLLIPEKIVDGWTEVVQYTSQDFLVVEQIPIIVE